MGKGYEIISKGNVGSPNTINWVCGCPWEFDVVCCDNWGCGCDLVCGCDTSCYVGCTESEPNRPL